MVILTVKLLLAKNASVEDQCIDGDDAIQFAIGGAVAYIEVLRLLLAVPGASVYTPNKQGTTALHRAVSKNFTEAITLFLNHCSTNKENINLLNSNGEAAPHSM